MKTILLASLIMNTVMSFAQPFLSIPIEGNYGQDYIIVNYVDWGVGADILDHNCGNKTYNGHQGTDFVLRSFLAMDSGVHVRAAADGVVTYVQDGIFDREKTSDVSKGFGNYIAIRHFNGYYTYYAHLVKNSILVSVGDTVKAEDFIAKVGSSGNSSDPHLHFEVWFDSIQLVDPFQGTCGNPQSLWVEKLDYDSSFNIWTSGLTGFIPTLDDLREEPQRVNNFSHTDEAITYWTILYGLREGDSLNIYWFNPSGELWFSNKYTVEVDAWYFYYWNYIDVPQTTLDGEWSAQLFRNGSFIDEIKFTTSDLTSIKEVKPIQSIQAYPNPFSFKTTIVWQSSHSGHTVLEVYDVYGKKVKVLVDAYKHQGENSVIIDCMGFESGTYFYKLTLGSQTIIKKLLLVK